MPSLKVEDVKYRSVAGVFALTSRTAILQVISFVGTFLLTIFLSPEVFGVFFIVSAVVAFLNYFSDIGLAAALVQREKVKNVDLNTTFAIQQLLVLTIVIVSMVFSKNISSFYNFSNDGLWLLRSLILAFFLASLKTIPSVILERKLQFNKLVVPQIVEVFFFYVLAVVLAWRGLGIKSFTWAVLIRGVSGLVVLYLIQPWWPRLNFSKLSAKSLLSFGVPFQLNSFLGLIKDDLFTLYLGKVLPFTFVGYIGWAKKWSEIPLRLIMDSIVRVTFPAYSRLQRHPEKLTKALNKSLFFLSFFIVPMSIGLMFTIKPVVGLIPRYSKWEPALFSFYFFVIGSALASISTPLTNALNATGKIKTTLKLMVMWTVLTWVISPLFIQLIGYNGVAVAHSLIASTLGIVVWVSKKYFKFSLLNNIFPPVAASLVMGVFIWFLRSFLAQNVLSFIILIVISTFIYFGTLLVFFQKKTLKEVKMVLAILKKN